MHKHSPQATIPYAVYAAALGVVIGVLSDLAASGNEFAKSIGTTGVFRALGSGFGMFKVCECLCSKCVSASVQSV